MTPPFPSQTLLLQTISGYLNTLEERNEILSMVCQLLADQVDHYNWVGFYLVDETGKNLVLGPYVGAPTDHTKIAFGNGICGQVAVSKTSRIIQDVHLEDNYLSCSVHVQSEVVFPIIKNGKFVAELDIDSHMKAPFGQQDTDLLEAICEQLEAIF